jgi:hypothetical protein
VSADRFCSAVSPKADVEREIHDVEDEAMKSEAQVGQEEKGGHEESGQQESIEEVKPKIRKEYNKPTEEEVREHEIDHAVFKAWCPHCVKGKAVSFGHYKVKSDKEVPVIAADYMYLTEKDKKDDEEDKDTMPILVAKDDKLKMIFASVVPKKGKNAFAVKKLAEFVDGLGHQKVILKSDNEESVLALKSAVKAEVICDVVMEESPVGDHAANGMVEATIRQVQGQFRSMKSALEERSKRCVGRPGGEAQKEKSGA